MFDGPMPGAAALLSDLTALGVPLYALTNMPAEVMPGLLRMFPFFSCFIDIIVSGEEGVIKPDLKIFEITARRLGKDPKDIFFIDDSVANVRAAQGIGFDAMIFTSMGALRQTIKSRGIMC
ncbi:MAG: HAD-IA family hydrolase [Robiginitomaculum sp.]|nr:HAD-IA family hydrolase [Robiginitomaculum sp.]